MTLIDEVERELDEYDKMKIKELRHYYDKKTAIYKDVQGEHSIFLPIRKVPIYIIKQLLYELSSHKEKIKNIKYEVKKDNLFYDDYNGFVKFTLF